MSINPTERIGDLVLPQGTYVLVQDGSNGQVDVIVGPNKTAMQETDKQENKFFLTWLKKQTSRLRKRKRE
jgi:hypothetical protein